MADRGHEEVIDGTGEMMNAGGALMKLAQHARRAVFLDKDGAHRLREGVVSMMTAWAETAHASFALLRPEGMSPFREALDALIAQKKSAVPHHVDR